MSPNQQQQASALFERLAALKRQEADVYARLATLFTEPVEEVQPEVEPEEPATDGE